MEDPRRRCQRRNHWHGRNYSRHRTREQQLKRFLGARSGRKLHYGQVLADALDLTRVPRPLDRVLAHV